MMLLTLLGIVLVAAAGIAAYFFIFHRPNPPLTGSEVKIGNTVFAVEIASTSVEKARGLSFRDSLAEKARHAFSL